MKNVLLKLPVHDLDGRLLLSEKQVLTPEVLQNLVDSNRDKKAAAGSLLQYGTIRDDLGTLLNTDPYRVIFNDPLKTDNVLKQMDRVLLPPALLAFLDHFKRHAPETYQHTLRVTALSAFIGSFLLETVQDLTQGILAAVAHDFGKTCIPLELLKKQASLTRQERGMLEQHTLAGYVLISYFLKMTGTLPARAARDHHERRDGSGYPLGINQEDRMVEIIAVSDIYDALVSDRPYRKEAYENRRALEEITEMAAAGKIGWEVVRALISNNRETKPDIEACIVSREKRNPPKPESTENKAGG
jgi:HD-GYP domain-containing protein (c-di-GMP phosphodiesterase class II)